MGPAPFTLLLLIGLAWTTRQGFTQSDRMSRWMFSVDMLRLRREWWRLLTSALLHQDWRHYLSNAVTLLFFAAPLERAFSPVHMLAVFLLSVLGGNLLSWSLHRHTEYRAIGASGGASGVLFATILLYPHIYIFGIIPGWLYAVASLGYTLYCMKSSVQPGIGHASHFGGALTGILLALVIAPSVMVTSPLLLVFLLILGAGGLWYTHANPAGIPGFLRMKVQDKRAEMDEKRQARNQDELDRILEKVSSSGLHSLSEKEKRLLHHASRQRGGKR